MEERFYYCGSCGNLFFTAIASGITPFCCGEEMQLLKANTQEGYSEKHLPVVQYDDGGCLHIQVGSQLHPMSHEHGIRFICVETNLGVIIRYLAEDEKPDVTIRCNGTPRRVYAYCNIHGLWRKDLPECHKVCRSD